MRHNQGKKNYYKGFIAEFVTILFLLLKNYKLIKWRYLGYNGEIDLIMKKRKCLIAVEVKYRKEMMEDSPLTFRQKERIYKSFYQFYQKNYLRLGCEQARIDAVFYYKWRLPLHIKNII